MEGQTRDDRTADEEKAHAVAILSGIYNELEQSEVVLRAFLAGQRSMVRNKGRKTAFQTAQAALSKLHNANYDLSVLLHNHYGRR